MTTPITIIFLSSAVPPFGAYSHTNTHFSLTLVTLKCAPTFIIYQSKIFYLITLFFSKLKNPVAGNNSKKQESNWPLKKHIFSFLFFIDMSCFINLLLSENGWLADFSTVIF